jgi:hypothetical protein
MLATQTLHAEEPTIAASGSEKLVVPQDFFTTDASLHPGAKGSLLCFCRGAVVKMLGHYGWVLAFGRVNHPMAEKRNGLIYVSTEDIVHGRALKAGDIVTFYLYVDGMGLGAEYCDVVQSADDPHYYDQIGKGQSLECKTTRMNGTQTQHQPDTLALPTAVYFVPVAYMITGTPYECAETDSTSPLASDSCNGSNVSKGEPGCKHGESDGKLPSIGSAGHHDGTCKRCAFFSKGRCLNGADCTHCHYDHVPHKRVRKFRPGRAGKQQICSDACDLASMPMDHADSAEGGGAVANVPSFAATLRTERESCDIVSRPFDEMESDACLERNLDDNAEIDGRGSKDDLADHVDAMSDFDSSHAEAETTAPSTSVLSDDEDGRSSMAMSPMSWSESQRMRRAAMQGPSSETSPSEIARMVRALLNKLTEDRFESITNQILALPLSGQDQLAAVTAEIFGKATMQDGFRSLYVELCVRLDAHLAIKDGEVGGKAFRKALVAECQRIFEKSLEPHDAALFENMTCDERFELENKLKTGRLGNMRFIGDLMVRQLLAQKLMMPIIHELLNGDESALESLIAFLYIVGPTFEKKSSLYRAPLQDVFATLRRKKGDVKISPRVRFLLSDLFDARGKDWASEKP